MRYHFRIGKLLKGLRRLVKQHLPVSNPENFLLFVQRVFQKPYGGGVGFSATCGENHERAVRWRGVDLIQTRHGFFLVLVGCPGICTFLGIDFTKGFYFNEISTHSAYPPLA